MDNVQINKSRPAEKELSVKDNSDSSDKNDTDSSSSYFWHIRGILIGCALVALLLFVGSLVVDSLRTHAEETGSFSSANLDRISRGIYTLRAEVTGDRLNQDPPPRRADTSIDFDLDLNITVNTENGVLVYSILNERNDIVVDSVHFRGHLLGTTPDCFHLIYSRKENLNLRYQEISKSLPISVYTTSENHRRERRSWRWLTNIEEFRETFALEFLEISFYLLDAWYDSRDEKILIRYTTTADSYQILEGKKYMRELNAIDLEIEEYEEETE